MDVIRTIKPGDKGSQRFLKEYGERLVAVRHRKSEHGLLTTIELIFDRKLPRHPNVRYDAVDAQRNQQRVALRIDYSETELRLKVKQAGGWWDKQNKVWRLEYLKVVALGLIDRLLSSPDKR